MCAQASTRSELERYKQKYVRERDWKRKHVDRCHEHARRYRQNHPDRVSKQHHDYWVSTHPPVIKCCAWCGRKFETTHVKRKIYCSDQCKKDAKEFRRKKRLENENPS